MKVLWIGHGHHRPAPDFPFVIKDGFFWHYPYEGYPDVYRFLSRGGHLIGELSDFRLDDGLYLRGGRLDPRTVGCAFFTWNCLGLGPTELERWLEIESFLRRENPSIRVLNSISEFPSVYYKSRFFEKMARLGFSGHVPEWTPVTGCLPLLARRIEHPSILRSNMDTGGRNSYLCRNRFESAYRCNSIRKALAKPEPSFQARYGAPGIIKVRYYDNYYPQFACHASFRAIFSGGKLLFIYPHVSTVDWCIHTDMEERSPEKKSFLGLCDFIYDLVGRQYELFQRLSAAVEVHNLAVDFVVHEGRPIFLEIEIKYGGDVNFVKGPLKRYALELEQFAARVDRIAPREFSFENFFGLA